MLRFRRVVALLLLAVSPGLGGATLEAVHSCITRDLTPAVQDGHAHHGGHHGGQDEAPQDHDGCSCIGDCNATPFAPAIDAPVVAFSELPPAAALPIHAAPHAAPSSGAFRLLPPATAPPIA